MVVPLPWTETCSRFEIACVDLQEAQVTLDAWKSWCRKRETLRQAVTPARIQQMGGWVALTREDQAAVRRCTSPKAVVMAVVEIRQTGYCKVD